MNILYACQHGRSVPGILGGLIEKLSDIKNMGDPDTFLFHRKRCFLEGIIVTWKILIVHVTSIGPSHISFWKPVVNYPFLFTPGSDDGTEMIHNPEIHIYTKPQTTSNLYKVDKKKSVLLTVLTVKIFLHYSISESSLNVANIRLYHSSDYCQYVVITHLWIRPKFLHFLLYGCRKAFRKL